MNAGPPQAPMPPTEAERVAEAALAEEVASGLSDFEALLAEQKPKPRPLTPQERAGAIKLTPVRVQGEGGGVASRWTDVGGQAFVNEVVDLSREFPPRLSASEERELSDIAEAEKLLAEHGRGLPAEHAARRDELHAKNRAFTEGDMKGSEIKRHLLSGDRAKLKAALAQHPRGGRLANML